MTDEAKLIDIKAVCDRVSVGKTTIYKWAREGTFPRGHEIAPGIRRWRAEEVEEWIKVRAPLVA